MTSVLSQEEVRDLIVSVGTHRDERRLSPLEVSDLFAKAHRGGATLGECAAVAGFTSASMVTRFLRLRSLPKSVQELIDWGASSTSLPFTAGAEIARLPREAHEPVALAVLAASLRSSEVTQVVQRLLRSDRSVHNAVAEILRLRPHVERRHVFVGRFADEKIGQQLRRLPAAARTEVAETALLKVVGSSGADIRLTPTGFVLVTGDEDADHLHGLADFESSVADAITEQLSAR